MARARRRTAWRTIPPQALRDLWGEAVTLHRAKRDLPSSRQLTDVPELLGFIGEYVFAQEIDHARPTTDVFDDGGDPGFDFMWKNQRVDVKAGRVVRGMEPDLLLFTDGRVRCDTYALVAVELPFCPSDRCDARIREGDFNVSARLTMICRATWAHDRQPVQLSTGCRIRVTPLAASHAHRQNAFVYQEQPTQ